MGCLLVKPCLTDWKDGETQLELGIITSAPAEIPSPAFNHALLVEEEMEEAKIPQEETMETARWPRYSTL